MPVRDAARWLDEAMASLLAQSFDDFEVVAVDDGSTDATPDLLRAWSERDGRVRVLRRSARGIVAALEDGRRASRGPYIARMDADDVAHPDRLARQLALLEAEPEMAACGTGVRYVPPDQVQAGARRYERWINGVVTPHDIAASIFVECPLAHPTLFMRAEVLDEVGGYRDTPWPEDYDLVLRLWAAGQRLGKVPEVLHDWREGPHRLSRTDPRYGAAAFRACKVHYLRRTLLEGDRAAMIGGAGPVGKALSRALRKEGTTVRAFVELDPRKIGQEIHGAPVLDTEQALGLEGELHLAAVGQAGARARIVDLLRSAGKAPLRDFVAVA
jgi:hypothetical protein